MYSTLGNVLKDIHGLLGLIVFKEELDVHVVYVNLQDLVSKLQKKIACSKDGKCLSNVYIIKHICIGNVPNHTNGSLPSSTGTIGAHIVLYINVKDCVERLCQNILDR